MLNFIRSMYSTVLKQTVLKSSIKNYNILQLATYFIQLALYTKYSSKYKTPVYHPCCRVCRRLWSRDEAPERIRATSTVPQLS